MLLFHNRGKYPSLFGIVKDKVVKLDPKSRRYILTDEMNADGNQRKRCLYESRLAKLIIEEGREFWAPGYQAINKLFLADFDHKSDPQRAAQFADYFDQIRSVLIKENLIEKKAEYTILAIQWC